MSGFLAGLSPESNRLAQCSQSVPAFGVAENVSWERCSIPLFNLDGITALNVVKRHFRRFQIHQGKRPR